MAGLFDDVPKQGGAQAQSGGGLFDDVPMVKRSGTIGETVDALVRGAANAVTFGFADRLAAAAGAATGIGGEFGKYSKNLEKQRAIDAANLEEHPIATIGGELAGSLALPVGAAARAATLPGRMAATAGVGAAQGALYGVGGSPDLTNSPQVLGNMAAGGAVGGLVGGLAPPVVEGLGKGASFLLNKTTIPQTIRGYRNPEGTAARLISDTIERDAITGSPRLTSGEFQDAVQAGQPAVTADMGGAATRNLARTAANMSPEAETALNGVINPRFEAQGPRIADMITSQGGGNSVETLAQLQDAARRANRPLYAQAYREGGAGIWTPEIEQLTAAPAMQDAIRGAVRTGANADVAAGFPATRAPFNVAQDGTLSPVIGPDGSRAIPSLQFWDHVQRNLRDMAGSAERGGENHAASVYGSLRRSLLEQLDNAAPTFAQARGNAARAFGAEDALEAGAKFATAKGQNQEYARAISEFTGPERQLFAHGFMSALENRVREVPFRQNVLSKIDQSPAARQRIEMAVGSERAERLRTFLHAESIMDMLRTAVQGNSSTAKQTENIKRIAEQLAAPTLFGGAGFAATGDLKDASAASLAGVALKRGSARVNADIMKHVGEMLASSDPAVVDRALATIKASKPIQQTLAPFVSRLSTALISNDAERRKASETQPDVIVPVGRR